MVDRPIIFSAPMVRALLAGRKTQTRRLIKVPGVMGGRFPILPGEEAIELDAGEFRRGAFHYASTSALSGPYRLPAAVGDRLYVREAFWIGTRYSYGSTPGGCEIDPPPLARRKADPVHFAADGNPPNCANRHYGPEGLRGGKSFAAPDPYAVWHSRPSIHMPRWASRITLIVEDVRCQPLQDITETDAAAEGTSEPSLRDLGGDLAQAAWSERQVFQRLWNSLHGADAWDANPWVVALSFRVERSNIDNLGSAA